MIAARYVHTNIIARDWRVIARFYTDVFGCVLVPPERDLRGEWLDRGTGVRDAHIRGVHLRLPGHGDAGPTIEIFTYDDVVPQSHPVANRAGYGHVAFLVEDVAAAMREVVAHGGKPGEIVSHATAAGALEFVYVRDPEDNLIELQRWT